MFKAIIGTEVVLVDADELVGLEDGLEEHVVHGLELGALPERHEDGHDVRVVVLDLDHAAGLLLCIKRYIRYY